MSRTIGDASPLRALMPVLALGLAVGAACGRGPVRVVDVAGALTPQRIDSITHYLEFVEAERGVDYRVVVLREEELDLVTEGVARYERLRVGRRTGGRGLVLVINMATEEARVEVGLDLEHRVRDIEASSMIRDLLAPYFVSGDPGLGVEASVERLVEILEPTREDEDPAGRPLERAGGAGASHALLEGIQKLTPEARARLRLIMVPQRRPEDCVELEMALMARGIYYPDVPMYDAAFRRVGRPSTGSRRLKSLAARYDGPFEIVRDGDHAIAAYHGEGHELWGPRFLRRTPSGWIIDGTTAYENIIYGYDNTWALVDGDYPYLKLVKRAYDMQPGTFRTRGPGWILARPGGS